LLCEIFTARFSGADGVSEWLLGFRGEGDEDLPDCPDA
jgi:hypothetical protein